MASVTGLPGRGASRLFPDGPCVIVPDAGMDGEVFTSAGARRFGPQSLAQALTFFPRDVLADLKAHHSTKFGNLIERLRGGISCGLDFAGMDMPSLAMHRMGAGLGEMGVELGRGFTSRYATDTWSVSQRLLQAYPPPIRPRHVFADVCFRWPQQLMHDLDLAAAAAVGQPGQVHRGTPATPVRAMAALLDDAVRAGDALRPDHCFICDKSCSAAQSAGDDHAFAMNVAGLQCVDFSGFGEQQNLSGPS